MEFKDIMYSHEFRTAVKPLSKKYNTLKSSLRQLQSDLCKDPYLGDDYGSGIYKVRLSDKSKGTGKSGGFRVLYYHLSFDEYKNVKAIIFITIFNKSEISTIKPIMAKKLKDSILSSMGFNKK